MINQRARTLFLVIIFFLLTLVNAVFAVVMAILFEANPGAVIPAVAIIPIAIVIGQFAYRGRGPILIPAISRRRALVRPDPARAGTPDPGGRARGTIRPGAADDVGNPDLRLHVVRVPVAGVALAPAAGLHKLLPTLYRARRDLPRHSRGLRPDRGPGNQLQRAGGLPEHLPVSVHNHRLRRDLGLPLPGGLRHFFQTTRQRRRRPVRGLHGGPRRGLAGARLDPGVYRRHRGFRRLAGALPGLRDGFGRGGRELYPGRRLLRQQPRNSGGD